MFSPDITSSDAYLEMPVSARDLYFQLGMNADDDGFVNPKRIMRMIGSSDDDLKILLGKRFLLPFESGVVVIKHWLIHNMIRKDRYKPTQYVEEKKSLYIKENGSYTDVATNGIPSGNQMVPQVRLGKVRLEEEHASRDSSFSGKEGSNTEGIERISSRDIDEYGGKRDALPGKAPKEPRTPRNKAAFRLRGKFGDMCHAAIGTRPVADFKGYKACLFATGTGGLTEEQVEMLFTDWFDQRKPDEELISITRALSANSINTFKTHNSLGI